MQASEHTKMRLTTETEISEAKTALRARLGAASRECGIYVADVAKRASYDPSTCAQYLGANEPRDRDAMRRFLKLMNLALDELLGERDLTQQRTDFAASPDAIGEGL